MAEFQFGGVLSIEDADVFATEDRYTLTVSFYTFTLPHLAPPEDPDDAKHNERMVRVAIEPLTAPAVLNGHISGNWDTTPDDRVEIVLDTHGASLLSRDDSNADLVFTSNFTISLPADATEFLLSVRLQQPDAPLPGQSVLAIDDIYLTITAAGAD